MKCKLKLRLLELREPQYVLAAKLGMNETRLSRIVQGRISPTSEERGRIAEAMGMPEEAFFGEPDE